MDVHNVKTRMTRTYNVSGAFYLLAFKQKEKMHTAIGSNYVKVELSIDNVLNYFIVTSDTQDTTFKKRKLLILTFFNEQFLKNVA